MIDFDKLRELEQLWLLALAHTDLSHAHQAVQFSALAILTEPAIDCIQDALIVRYCRPFKPCELPNGKGRTCLPNRFAEVAGINPDLHINVCTNRDKVAAHSDMSVKDVVFTKLSDDGRFRARTSAERFSREQVVAIGHLVLGVMKNVQEAAMPLAQRLLAGRAINEEVELRTLLLAP